MQGDPVVLGVYDNEFEAKIVKSKLESSGIKSYIMKDDTGGMIGSMQLTMGVKLLVNAEDADQAETILEDFKNELGIDPDNNEENGNGE